MHPQLIKIGDFFIPTYGVLVTLGFLAGLWLSAKLAKRQGMDPNQVVDLAIYCALAGIIGAKLLMVLSDFSYYREHPREIVSITTLQAGGIFQGGLILALATAYLIIRRKKMPGLATADVIAPGIALGYAIGRLGCFSAGCCWGQECHLPWAVTFRNPVAHEMFGTPLDIPLHPTQLYSSFSSALIVLILLWRISKPHRDGAIVGLYLVLYSVTRFLIEFARDHELVNPLYGPLSAPQWIALATFALGLWLLRRNAGRAPTPAPLNKRAR
jgi:phosphatidylglycerol:prolipoprotein diacylglycerol transferase